ncbi:hypothetical protein ACFOET_14170 [Parapedobacter deserti]|uniref:Uncharacterized protein n=1 Tax=Parapedobacter deserti TaxID=1912957 RepID=A0ABV7JPM4_9SPHI
MENLIDRELIARIRGSDEEAFYQFCNRHWKSVYVPILMETGRKDEAFERVKGLFAGIWDRRRQLPELTTTVEQYIIANGLAKQPKDGLAWTMVMLIDEVASFLKKMSGSLGVLLTDKRLKYK